MPVRLLRGRAFGVFLEVDVLGRPVEGLHRWRKDFESGEEHVPRDDPESGAGRQESTGIDLLRTGSELAVLGLLVSEGDCVVAVSAP